MKVRNAGARSGDKIELQMTPMIDIVFQLLVFFIMTFKIVAMEGDFNIKMPLAAPSEGKPDDRQLPPMVLRMTANPDGSIGSIKLDGRSFAGPNAFVDLRNHIIGLLGDDRGPGSIADTAEVELSCDYSLDYLYVIEAITAVTGYVQPGTEKIIKLVEKIKFTPPQNAPAG